MTDQGLEYVRDSEPVEGVRLLQLNRPERRNALATPVLRRLRDLIRDADSDPDIGAIVVTGGADIFAAGADLNELLEKSAADALLEERPAIWRDIRHVSKPVIGAVEGWCLGAGNELLLCMDIAVAGKGAKFGQPETNLGIMPGAGGCVELARRIGRMAAMQLVLTGRVIDAEEALRLGLISQVVEKGEAGQHAVNLAATLASRAPLAIRQAKAAILSASVMPVEQSMEFERQAFCNLLNTEDKVEGISAFLEKRAPVWKGK